MVITPQNYFTENPVQRTVHQTRVNYVNGSVTDALSFGVSPPTCQMDLSLAAPKTESFVGEVYISKFPYHPDAQMIGDPADAIAAGFPGTQ